MFSFYRKNISIERKHFYFTLSEQNAFLTVNNIADLYRNFNDGIFSQTKILVELIITYPNTSNEGERSFSQLKRLLTSLRTNMTEGRICNRARMCILPGCTHSTMRILLRPLQRPSLVDWYSREFAKTIIMILMNLKAVFVHHFSLLLCF